MFKKIVCIGMLLFICTVTFAACSSSAHVHDWGKWVVIISPTETTQGVEKRVCKRDSSHTQTQIVAALGGGQELLVSESGLWFSARDDGYEVIAYSGTNSTVLIPAYCNNKPVTAIGDGVYMSLDVVGWVPPEWTKHMFPGNKNITNVTFEEDSLVERIGWVAFSDCANLINFETPSSLRYIGESAFKDTGIWNNTTDNEVVYVGNWVVGYKGNSDSVVIKPGTVGIASCAFYDSSVTNIEIPKSVKKVNGLAFYESALEDNAPDNSVIYADKWVVGHKGNLGAVTLKANTVGIADSGLEYGSSLTSIVIPPSVENIGESAFVLCKSLTDVTIKKGLKIIEDSAFLYCSALKSISIPQSVTKIGAGAFGDCRALTDVELPSGITEIKNGTFSGCNALSDITIPSSVTIIGNYAFMGTAIKHIVIPKGVIWIGANAFVVSNQMEKFMVETGNKFYRSDGNCLIEIATDTLLAGFNNTVIPNDVKHIAKNAFQGLQITSISIPDSVLTIGDQVFYCCTKLETVNFGKILTEIGEYAFACTALTNVELPSDLIKIGGMAFWKCESLARVVLPVTLRSIGGLAFAYCDHLESIYIPISVAAIGSDIFRNCSNLTIYAEAETKPDGWNDYWNTGNCPTVWGHVV